ncbi:hypothetical protein QTP70_004875 [Hemibagrus guttatus]|uniref:Reverse transcriptase domain-containing protein n=1 Tax=Hemibagrus guttatus TaxID=175788 RepID=A0AAE0V9X8_9TELE|nr:hypothetical protein QTP70_004875 [Hemibagrus guttatus]
MNHHPPAVLLLGSSYRNNSGSRYRHLVLSVAYEHPWSGHLGITKTYNRVLKHFFWTRLCQDLVEYCASVAPDFTNPFKLEIDASGVGIGAVLLQEDENEVNHPVCYLSPGTFVNQCRNLMDIVSDWGTQFTSRVWRAFCMQWDINHKWSEFLPWVEYAQNSLMHSSTGLTPFQPPMFSWSGTPANIPAMDDWINQNQKELYCQLLISSSSSSYTFIPVSPTQLHTLATPHPPPLIPLTIKEEEVNRLFKCLNTRKATGPDSISPSLLKHCAKQLSPVFTDIFNTSLETCHVPACFKTSAIVPVPKKTKITGLNDYRPVALTSVVMKSFEHLVLSYLKDITDPLLDPLQFAYRANRSVDDVVNMALHFILQHLDSPGSYARIQFLDHGLPDRQTQFVRLGMHVSDLQHISTGSPQGCVLSPLLFSLYTNGCTSGHQSVKLLKFADDTTLIGLISDGDDSAYRGEIDRLVSWCSMNNLELNSLKTVEMIVDFRKDPAPLPPVILCNSPVTSAESFCFLGTTITKELKWEQNIRSLTKKAQQRMYFLWQLKKFLLPVKMLVNFYTAIIESILTSSITVWFAAATARDKAKLQCVIHSALSTQVIGCSLPSLQELYISRSQRHGAKIAGDPSHPGN